MKESPLFRGMSQDGSARILVLNSKSIVCKMQEIHHTAPTATAALGRLLTGASLIGSMQGEKEDSITIRIDGNGEIRQLLAVADYYGNVRGTIDNPNADPARKKNGHLDVGGAIGDGTLTLIHDHGTGDPQIGTVRLTSGEIAEDLATYFSESEQIPTVCALGVLVGPDQKCMAAGGFLIQLLPFADEAVIDQIEKNITGLDGISSYFQKGLSCKEIADILFKDIPYDPFDEIPVSYKCHCSRARMKNALKTISKKELRELFDEQEKEGKDRILTCHCHFCNKDYNFSENDLSL